MKKTVLTFFALLGVASSSMAAYQYGDYVQYNRNNNQTLEVTSDSNLTFEFFAPPWWHTTVITDWSTMTVVTTNNITGQASTRDVAITGSNVNIGDVVTGDQLAFYVSGNLGTTLTTNQKHFFGHGWDTSTATHDWLVFDGNYGANNSGYTQLHFRVNGQASGGASGPSGQPLPGVAMTLLVGGVSAFIVKRKKSATC